MKKRGFLGALLLAGALAAGSGMTAAAAPAAGVPYTGGAPAAGPGGIAALPEISLSEEEQQIKDTLQQAIDKTNAVQSYQVTGQINMNITAEGVTIPIVMNMDSKFQGSDADSARFLVDMKMNMMGTDIPVTYFYEGDYLYMDMLGSKIKMALPLDEAMKQAQSGMSFDAANGTEGLTNLNMAENNGVRTIYYTYDPAYLNSYVEQVLNTAGMGSAQMDTQMHIAKCVGESSVNADGYVVNQKLSMNMTVEVTAAGQTSQAAMDMFLDMNYVNVGQAIDFRLPSTDGYTEMPADMTANMPAQQ